MLATNTSSLPVAAIAESVPRPERVCGMHFFNPPALMRLVEIVAAERTVRRGGPTPPRASPGMGREPVRCTRLPRVHRQPLQPAVRAGVAADRSARASRATSRSTSSIRADGGYRMGPFELMDLIGIDVNLEVARSFYAQRAEPRWSRIRSRSGWSPRARSAGRSGRGFYEYAEGAPAPARGRPAGRRGCGASVLDRVVAQLVNEAAYAVGRGRRRAGRHRRGDAARAQPPAGPVRVGARARARAGRQDPRPAS